MRPLSLWFWFGVGSVVATFACSNSNPTEQPPDETEGQGGTNKQRGTGRGGSTAEQTGAEEGGARATGGNQGTGGTKAAGGSSGKGGATGKGGSQGQGGSQTGGASQAGGGSQGVGGSEAPDGGGDSGTAGAPGAGGSNTTGCDDTATAQGTLTGAKDSQTIAIDVTGKTKSYQLHTNWWHKYTSQAVDYNGLSFGIRDPSNTSVPPTDGAPTGFPTLFIGTYAGNATKGSNLPKKVTEIQSVPTVFSTNALAKDHSNYNATYDVWFTGNGNTLPPTQYNPGADGAYLMVWFFKPQGRQPRGGQKNGDSFTGNHTNHTVEGIPGTWDVWVDPPKSTDGVCISYVATTERDSMEFDLNKFIQDAIKNNYGITNSMYLSIVFAGFEIWGGGDGLQTKRFCAQVN